ncbi:MAG TPA: tRNA 2-thiouridine(34) synthase MnmA [Candidatus Paceibacterota bacterium]|nr:tRNA 2-thiouridine(34) synthase MnmA [Candidatus Paceibacterota bacterium]
MKRAVLKKTVFVGMSGGVDSSVAALLLANSPEAQALRKKSRLPAGRQGYEVVGVFMRCYNIDGCAERDAEDARRVAGQLGIPFYVWDFEKEYKKRVVRYMIDGYRKGLTPNPDVMCNREIKFGLFFEKARRLGADFVATGHYVRLKNGKLFTALDKNKDQSYFLWTLAQAQLAHCLFPIGDYVKPEVRRLAKRAALATAEKKDSQGICFLGDISIREFLKKYIPEKRGVIVTPEGVKIGEHRGAWFYTIGQRQGLDLKDKNSALGIRGEHATMPHYVVAKDVKKNIVVVAEGSENKALFRKEVELADINIISGRKIQRRLSVRARVRYRQPVSPAILELKKNGAHLLFKNPQKFVAEGQSAVFYSKTGEMLGGGVIV